MCMRCCRRSAPSCSAAQSAVTAESGPVLGLAQTFFAQGAELLRNPGRTGGWDQVDLGLLQGIGRMSMSVAGAIQAAAQAQPALAEQLTGGARILDIGTGTGWLAIALAEAYPQARVVGIDIFAPALALARANISAANLDERIELRQQNALALADTAEFSAVWLPLPFLAADIVPGVLEAVRGSLGPAAGWWRARSPPVDPDGWPSC